MEVLLNWDAAVPGDRSTVKTTVFSKAQIVSRPESANRSSVEHEQPVSRTSGTPVHRAAAPMTLLALRVSKKKGAAAAIFP